MENQPREIQLAWLAGIIDGEGNFSLGTPQRPNCIRIRVYLKSSDKHVIELIQKIVGGRLEHRGPQASWPSHWSDQWGWVVSSKAESLRVAKELLPYLVLKKDKAEEVIRRLEK